MPKLRLDKMVWSFSRLTSFEQCPLGWWYTYHYKINRDVTNAFAEYGTLCHELIQSQMIFRQRNMSKTNKQMKDEFQRGFYNLTNKFISSKMKRDYLYDGIRYFENWDSFEGYNVKSVEQFTNWNIDGYNCTGGMDLLLEKDGELYLIDHKTSKPYPPAYRQKKIKQLYFYGLSVKKLFGKFPEYVGFNFIRDEKIQTFKWNANEFDSTMDWFRDTISKIERTKKFVANPDAFFCNYICNHRFMCPERAQKKKLPPSVY